MTAFAKTDLGHPPAPPAAARPTRRGLLTLMAVAPTALPCHLWATDAKPHQVLPIGEAAVALAWQITVAALQRPTHYVGALYHSWKRNTFKDLLGCYGHLYLNRVCHQPTAVHMLSVADAISEAMRNFNMLRDWRNPNHRGLLPERFAILQREARLIELERFAAQLARVRGALAKAA